MDLDIMSSSPVERKARRVAYARVALVLAPLALFTMPLAAQQAQLGQQTGLPVPRYVSLKSDRVNLHEGPAKTYPTTWIYQRAGLPVEITAEVDTWRKIRDSEGSEGWVLHSLLSGRRTALIAPWKKETLLPLYRQPSASSQLVANLQSGVQGNVKTCNGTWCRIYGDGFDGYEEQTNLWGVYPGEQVE